MGIVYDGSGLALLAPLLGESTTPSYPLYVAGSVAGARGGGLSNGASSSVTYPDTEVDEREEAGMRAGARGGGDMEDEDEDDIGAEEEMAVVEMVETGGVLRAVVFEELLLEVVDTARRRVEGPERERPEERREPGER